MIIPIHILEKQLDLKDKNTKTKNQALWALDKENKQAIKENWAGVRLPQQNA